MTHEIVTIDARLKLLALGLEVIQFCSDHPASLQYFLLCAF